MKRATIRAAADWVLPPRVFEVLTTFNPRKLATMSANRSAVASNRALHDRHAGERCFIVGNGPSLREQDLRPLANELVITVSNGFLHEDFDVIAPRYHCVPEISRASLSEDRAAEWLRRMDDRLSTASIVLDVQEHDLVKREEIFTKRESFFLPLVLNRFSHSREQIYDLSRPAPRVQSVPVMAIMLAMYMGCESIYLLGCDHDWFVTGKYLYFFDRRNIDWKDSFVAEDGTIEATLDEQLPSVVRLWDQYKALRRIAEANEVRIFNATAGGALDLFPRLSLEATLSRSDFHQRSAD